MDGRPMQRESKDRLYAEPRHVTDLESCYFYHTVDLPDYGVQQGEWDLRGDFGKYTDGYDFTGKRVLDIGAGSGFLTFSAEQAGAREVVSFDMDTSYRQDFLPQHDSLQFRDREAFASQHDQWIDKWRNAYWLTHRLNNSKARIHYGDVYRLPKELGRFDVTIVGSILEHLADPIKALASISRVTADDMIIVTPMEETEDKIARFMGDADRPDVLYVFWVYSLGVYRHVLAMLDFEITKVSKTEFTALWTDVPQTRHTITARRRSPLAGDVKW